MADLPVWVPPILFVALAALLAVGIYVFAHVIEFSRMPRTRLYDQGTLSVFAAAKLTVGELGYVLTHEDDQTISFCARHGGGGRAELFIAFPVVHVVILPTATGKTGVELVGAKSRFDYGWHSLAQFFLTAMDRTLNSAEHANEEQVLPGSALGKG
jgi:hypothetical protein